MSAIVDLDRIESWPPAIAAEVAPLLPEVPQERAAMLAFEKSHERFFKDGPGQPATAKAHSIINREMAGRRLRVFHATRLLDFGSVLREGMLPLRLERQMAAFGAALAATGHPEAETVVEELSSAAARTTDYGMGGRQGQVWFTPLRRSLHDGGCDDLFGYWGGEALRHLLQLEAPELLPALRSLGRPAVVVANIPTFGCCRFGDSELAPTMLGLMLERANLIDYSSKSWDVLVQQPIPVDWIEEVLAPNDPRLQDNSASPN